MKKLLLGIVTIVYLFAASGFSIEHHYCMGKLASSELFGSKQDKCPKCGMTEKKAGCCHDEQQFFKLKDSHKLTTNEISCKIFLTAEFANCSVFEIQLSHTTSLNNDWVNFYPPDISKPSINIINCNLRI